MHPSRYRTHRLSFLVSALIALAFGCTPSGRHDGEGGAGGAAGNAGASGEGGASGDGVSGEGGGGVGGIVPQPPGEFVSADANPGEIISYPSGMAGTGGAGGVGGMSGSAGTGGQAPDDPREVVEGDIYRVLDAGTLLNLNSYRGLQVIDVSDPSAPAFTGRLNLIGTPVEMYVRGTTAFVLLNNWQAYYGSREDVQVEHKQGGLVAVVDISDRAAPRELDRMFVEGNIVTSRVVQNDSVAALYIASSRETYLQNGTWSTRTFVTSFDISSTSIIKRNELDLGGYVTDIQATPTELLVAGSDWSTSPGANTVSLVDISDPNGAMVLGDTIATAGQVQSQFNMDLYNGVLRVVTQSWNVNASVVETFDASDLANVTPITSCQFGENEQLFATLFLGNKAFFVTYFRTDPFHAFLIGDDGSCAEQSEFIVSGWNDFFRPVAGETRLIGIGTDDADGNRTPAVSLYDITNMQNPSPLLAREDAGNVGWAWSEAQVDHRAFSVIEDAVSVPAGDGTTETGLVLLPYEGSVLVNPTDVNSYEYISGVALFTFSDHTVTQRGTLRHDSPVRRTFTTDSETIANLSETSLSLYDHSDPTDPEALGTLELAPDYRKVLRFGDYVARVKRPSWDVYSSPYVSSSLTDRVEIVPAGSDLDVAPAVASFAVPYGSQLLKAGDLLISSEQVYATHISDSYVTRVALYDLSDPTHPRAAGTAETHDLKPTDFAYGYGFGYGYGYGFVGCGYGYSWFSGSQADGVFALGDKIVFVDARVETATAGRRRNCSYYPATYCDTGSCQDHLSGYAECTSRNGGPETCTSNLSRCDIVDQVPTDCVPVDREDVRDALTESCSEYDVQRAWSRYAFKALDVSDPDAPVFGPLVLMPRVEEGVSVLPSGDSLYYTYRVPVQVPEDERPYVSYYYKHIDFGDVAAPAVATAINIPGELIAVNGARLYAKDLRWGERAADTYLHELSVSNDRAAIESSRGFTDREVSTVIATGDRLYAVHSETGDYYEYTSDLVKLALLDGDGLTLDAELDIDSWATLEAVHDGRALFSVAGGLLMMNVEDAAAPYAQAFFHSNGWPEQIMFEGDDVVISAGRYGIHRFDADATNLLTED